MLIVNPKLPFGDILIEEYHTESNNETFFSTDKRGTSKVSAQSRYLSELLELHTKYLGSTIIN